MGYGVVGGLQLLADWGVFVLLTGLGLAVVPGNLLGRVAGASLGFWLNGRYTFSRDGQPRLGGQRLLRFGVVWAVLTIISTLAVQQINAAASLQWAWMAKPAVDALLALAGFAASRRWIYR
jgi:putative flippase GtrA